MKRQKRLAAALLCLCMALSLAACGGSGGGGKEPVPLSKFVSKGTHLAYLNFTAITKDSEPKYTVLLEDGNVTTLKHAPRANGEELTYGKMSEMTDKEIAELVHADPDVQEDCSYYLFMETDASGNTPVYESLRVVYPDTGTHLDVFIYAKTGGRHTQAIYDDEYTAHSEWNAAGAWSVRGAGFTFDTPKTDGILLDMTLDDHKAMMASFK